MTDESLNERWTETLGARQLELLRGLLAEGFDVELRVTGSSMAPFIVGGDLVTVSPCKMSPRASVPIKIGDIVAFVAGGRLVIHRLVARSGGRLVARGDAAGRPDEPVEADDVLGTVTRILRDGRPRRRGLGPARRLLAALSRRGILASLTTPWRRAQRLSRRRSTADGSGRK